MSFAAHALNGLLDLMAPRDCPACGEPARRSLCSACHSELEPPRERELWGAPVMAAAAYRAPLSQAIQRFKYEARPDLARPLANLLGSERLKLASRDPRTLFVPVPLHRSRLAERGYDQAALLAAACAGLAGRRSSARALFRVRSTLQQARLDEQARQQNVVGAFAVNPRARLAGCPVVLVDDVITTGATAGACLHALRAAGARVVAVACIALAAR